MNTRIWCAALTLSAALSATSSEAGEGGGSHYVPGTQNEFLLGVFGPPGLYLRNDLWAYRADIGAHVRNGVAVGEASQDVFANTTKLSWLSAAEFFGARYGATVGFTYVIDATIEGEAVSGARGFSRGTSLSGASDLYVAPVLLNWAGETQHVTFKLGTYLPSGAFDDDKALNASRNYWSAEVATAYTYFDPQSGYELSANLGFIHNWENPKTEYRSGDEVHLDWTAARHVSKTFTAGLSGYFYTQVQADEGTVVGPLDASSIKAWSYGLGPVAQWTVPVGGSSVGLIAKALFDVDASDRLSGNLYMLSLTYAF